MDENGEILLLHASKNNAHPLVLPWFDDFELACTSLILCYNSSDLTVLNAYDLIGVHPYLGYLDFFLGGGKSDKINKICILGSASFCELVFDEKNCRFARYCFCLSHRNVRDIML